MARTLLEAIRQNSALGREFRDLGKLVGSS